MTDKEILLDKYNKDEVTYNHLSFGRQMPFGKYKGQYIYYLLVKHWRYMDWIVTNTDFILTDTEKWWKSKIDTFIECRKADNLISGLAGMLGSCIPLENENNPHLVIE